MAVKEYNPAAIDIIVAGFPITGIAPGTFVKVERRSPNYKLTVGAGGEGVRAKSNDKSGKITLTLLQSSLSNDMLSALSAADEANGSGVGPFLIKDRNGTTLESAATCWVETPAASEFAAEASNREWVLETDDLNKFVGGANQAG